MFQSYYYSTTAKLGLWQSTKTILNGQENSINQLLTLFSGGSVEVKDINLGVVQDSALLSLVAVMEKILSRGYPTISFYDYESRLIKNDDNYLDVISDLSIDPNSRIVGYLAELPNDYDFVSVLKSLLVSQHNSDNLKIIQMKSLDDAVKKITSKEEDIFWDALKNKISPEFQAIFTRQPLLEHLISDSSNTFIRNRVDYASIHPDLQLVIEIDGEQHNDSDSLNQDALRNKALKQGGWDVLRFTAHNIRVNINVCIDELVAYLKTKNIKTDQLKLHQAFLKNKEDKLIHICYNYLLLPHIVQKTMRAIIEAIKIGLIKPDQKQSILCLEEDIPVFHEAIYQIMQLWESLQVLSDHLPKRPELEITIAGKENKYLIPRLKGLQINYSYKTEKSYDLIISSSGTLFSGQCGLLENQVINDVKGQIIRFRNVYCRHDFRKLEWSSRIEYTLEDLENVLIDGTIVSSNESIKAKNNALLFLLTNVFRKKDFWDGQLRVITRLLQGKDTIVLLPTGGGKSLTYQFAGLLLPGITIIIDPLVALMTDQVDNISNYGIDQGAYIASILDQEEQKDILSQMENGGLSYVFIAPERMQIQDFRNRLHTVISKYPISLAVLDEAHCVSEWGHDFRPSYLHLGKNIVQYCSKDGLKPTLVGLTGTASFAVLADIQIEMNINDEKAIVLPKSFDRKEIIFHVQQTETVNKYSALKVLKESLPRIFNKNSNSFFSLAGNDTNCGIVFCPHSGGTHGVVNIAVELGHSNYYAGSRPKEFDVTDYKAWNQYKTNIQNSYKQNQVQEIVATKAFGMGIDKPNIRYTIHYAIPHSVEAFYQEAGRAGRNGKPQSSHSFIIYSDDNWETARNLTIEKDHKRSMEILSSINKKNYGDLLIQLWLLLNGYKDRENEKKDAYLLWKEKLAQSVKELSIGSENTVTIPFLQNDGISNGDNLKSEQEKSIYRLLILGVVTDYTVDNRKKVFQVKTKRATQEEVVKHLHKYLSQYKFKDYADKVCSDLLKPTTGETLSACLSVMVDFVYDEIVVKRKQALRTMAELCKNFQSDEQFRASILAYLQDSEYTPILKQWIKKPFREIGFDAIYDLLDKIRDLEEVKRLVGTTRRMLDEDPQNVAIRYVSVVSRSRSKLESRSSVFEEFQFLTEVTQMVMLSEARLSL